MSEATPELTSLSSDALNQLFLEARSRNAWKPVSFPDTIWKQVYDLMKMGPTSANGSPARLVFCTSEEAKARATKHMMPKNAEKSAAASAIVIIGYDMEFHEKMPELFPHAPGAKVMFSDPTLRAETAFRNGSLQGAYLMMAARSLGLDCGPISGFNAAGIDEEFFANTTIKSNFICMLGVGADTPFPRLPRLSFEDACQLL